jgi:hypothetical protein
MAVLNLAEYRTARTKAAAIPTVPVKDKYQRAVAFLKDALPVSGMVSQKYLEAMAAQQGISRSILFSASFELPLVRRKGRNGWSWGIAPRPCRKGGRLDAVTAKTAEEFAGVFCREFGISRQKLDELIAAQREKDKEELPPK